MSTPATPAPADDAATAAALAAAEQAGFDLNLIDCNLALSPDERLLRHAAALELAQELRAAGRQHHAPSAPAAAAAR